LGRAASASERRDLAEQIEALQEKVDVAEHDVIASTA
jgi:hypothetical protein